MLSCINSPLLHSWPADPTTSRSSLVSAVVAIAAAAVAAAAVAAAAVAAAAAW